MAECPICLGTGSAPENTPPICVNCQGTGQVKGISTSGGRKGAILSIMPLDSKPYKYIKRSMT